MKLSYRGVNYQSEPTRRLLERETTAKYRGVTYTIQQFGQVLPAPAPDLKYRGISHRPCLSAMQVQSQVSQSLTNFADSDFFVEYSDSDRI